ncbi:MAG TPA: dihydropteroate synthase [Candidatus Bathyarchaeia archaeon]|nr:dihydropteroate synthase [Candidatus Bathyarchaeia archaeon]
MTSIGKVRIEDELPARIMGVINVSPESFYKNSVKTNINEIGRTSKTMQERGADIIDVGAMSTAPYLTTLIPVEQETNRIKNAIDIIKSNCSLPISVDTPRAEVAKEAIKVGADAVNDISGLKYDKKMADVVSRSGLPVILGAYGGNRYASGRIFGTMKVLNESISIAKSASITTDNIIIDPAVGFFREKGQNPFFTKMIDLPWYIRDLEVISNLAKLKIFLKPICVCVSRKSFIGNILNLEPEDRLIPSVAAELVCALNGANLIRTHDVKQTRHTLIMLELLH